jgi:hypothetical protein
MSATILALVLAASPAAPFAQLREGWAEDLAHKRVETLVARYADDAGFISPQGERTRGRDALRKLFTLVTSQFDSHIEWHSVTTESRTELAFDSGDSDGLSPPGQRPVADRSAAVDREPAADAEVSDAQSPSPASMHSGGIGRTEGKSMRRVE